MRINEIIAESTQVDEGPLDALRNAGNAAMQRLPAGLLGKAAKFANKIGAKGTAQNLAGRTSHALTAKNLSNELQNYLGTKGVGLGSLTPDALAQFLTAKGVNVRPTDIQANKNGTVDRSTVGTIIRDLAAKSLSGEPLVYRKSISPKIGADSPAVAAYKAKKANTQPGFTGYNKGNSVPAAGQSTGAENYIQSWSSQIRKAKTKQEKVDLARELAAFLSDRAGTPEGSRGAQQAVATLSRLAKGAGNKKSTSGSADNYVDPNDPADIRSDAAKLRKKWKLGNEPVDDTVPPGEQLSMNDYRKIAAAIQQGKKLSPSLRIESADYSKFTQILEMLELRLADLNLWRVIKESTDQYVVLQTR